MWKTSKGNKIRLLKIGITNCYLIEYGELKILVDTGQKRAIPKLTNVLKSFLGTSSNLNFIVLTHTHYDHVQNAKIIKSEYSPKLIVHKNESGYLQNGFTRPPKGTNIVTKIISNLGKWIGKYEAVKADMEINQELFIDNNSGLKIIETPGHTTGSISLIIDNEIALVGDTLFGIFDRTVFPPFADDKDELFKSWEKLLQTSCTIFLPGHGKAIKREFLEQELKKRKKLRTKLTKRKSKKY